MIVITIKNNTNNNNNDNNKGYRTQLILANLPDISREICRRSLTVYIVHCLFCLHNYGFSPNFAFNIKRINQLPFPQKSSENHRIIDDFRMSKS